MYMAYSYSEKHSHGCLLQLHVFIRQVHHENCLGEIKICHLRPKMTPQRQKGLSFLTGFKDAKLGKYLVFENYYYNTKSIMSSRSQNSLSRILIAAGYPFSSRLIQGTCSWNFFGLAAIPLLLNHSSNLLRSFSKLVTISCR